MSRKMVKFFFLKKLDIHYFQKLVYLQEMLITCITGTKITIWRECLHLQPEMKLVGNKSEIQQRSKQTPIL